MSHPSPSASLERPRRFGRSDSVTPDLLYLLRAGLPRGRILDLPAGAGQLSRALLGAGYEVVPADLFPGSYREDSRSCVQADMNGRLPFADNSFDGAISQEGIEHIEAPLSFLCELARVLRPGGVLLVTTPNVLHMSARLSYVLTGHRTSRRGYINELTTLLGRDGDRHYHGHAFHWRYPQLRYMARLAGFSVGPPETGPWSLRSVLLGVPLWPVLWLAHWRSERAAVRKAARHVSVDRDLYAALLREIRGHLLSKSLLFGRTTILRAVRGNAQAGVATPRHRA